MKFSGKRAAIFRRGIGIVWCARKKTAPSAAMKEVYGQLKEMRECHLQLSSG